MTDRSKWVVTTSGKLPFAEVHAALAAAEFQTDQALEAIGVFTGTSDDGVIRKVRDLPGVADVSPDTPIDVGPPDAPVS